MAIDPVDEDRIRRAWLMRLGRAADLDFPLFAAAHVFPREAGVTVAAGELCTGRIALGDELEAVGYSETPVRVRVARIEQPDTVRRVVEDCAIGVAGQSYGLTLEHDARTPLVAGQCLAPAGRLRQTSSFEADVWIASAEDWPIVEADRLAVLGELGAGRGLRLFFHTRAVGATTGVWAPEAGGEYRLRFELDDRVPIYEGARFGVLYETLTVGAGFLVETD